MTRAAAIDLGALCGPPADGSAAGIDLRADEAGRAIWSAIREYRDEARRIERESDQDRSVDRNAASKSWEQLAATCADVLVNRSRDLGVAAALVEAWARLDGFAGIAAGCDVARTMVEHQWPDLYPIPDPEDGPADERTTAMERALPLIRLAGEDSEGLLVPAILHVPLVDGRDGQRYGLCHWRSSRDLRGVDDQEELKRALERGGTSPDQFQAAVASTGKPFLQQVFSDIRQARLAWDALAEAVGLASDGMAVVPALPLRVLYEECEDALKAFAADAVDEVLRQEPSEPSPSADGATQPSTSPAAEGLPLATRPMTREDALLLLEKVAVFFEQGDPHSLLAVQVKNVVRMARLPPAEYYRELIQEDSGLQSLSRMVGLSFDG